MNWWLVCLFVVDGKRTRKKSDAVVEHLSTTTHVVWRLFARGIDLIHQFTAVTISLESGIAAKNSFLSFKPRFSVKLYFFLTSLLKIFRFSAVENNSVYLLTSSLPLPFFMIIWTDINYTVQLTDNQIYRKCCVINMLVKMFYNTCFVALIQSILFV